MTLRFACPSCGATYSAPDQFQGKQLRCKKCEEVFTAEPEEESSDSMAARPAAPSRAGKPSSPHVKADRPAPPRPEPAARRKPAPPPVEEDPDDEVEEIQEKPRKKKSGRRGQRVQKSALPMILLGVIGLLVLVGGGLAGALLLGKGKQPQPVAVNPEQPANPTPGPGPSGPGTNPTPGPGPSGPGTSPPSTTVPSTPMVETPPPSSGPYSSPQATWETLTTANTSRDHRTFISSFSPTSQKQMVSRQAYTCIQARYEKDAQLRAQAKPILDALDKHGLTAEATKGFKSTFNGEQDEKNMAGLTPLIKDPVGLWTDLYTAWTKLPSSRDEPSTEFVGQLKDVKIQGDRATAVLFQKFEFFEQNVPVVFIKVEGKWKFDPPPKP